MPLSKREIADQLAVRFGLPSDWINEGVKRMAPPPGDPQPNLILSGEYPRSPNSIVVLRVHLPPPAYMLAMKILASRAASVTDKFESDLSDAVGLMKVTKLATEQQLVDLLKECYPSASPNHWNRSRPKLRSDDSNGGHQAKSVL